MNGAHDRTTSIPRLPVGRYRLLFEGERLESRESYWGSAWRGLLGTSLKRLVCITRLEECPPCFVYRSCIFPYVFLTPPPLGSVKLPNYIAAPHPFVLIPGSRATEGVIELGLNLFGLANRYLAYLVHALREGARSGLRKRTGPLELVAVEQETAPGSGDWKPIFDSAAGLSPLATFPAEWPAPAHRLRMEFHTPLRLRLRDDLVAGEELDFRAFFVTLLRRISLLTYFHTDEPLETDFRGLAERARDVRLSESRFEWKDWTRYSSRQQTKLKMGGLVGSTVVELEAGDEFWPYLWLGQWTHVGKGTSMGLGRYTLEILA
jgi:hypothetical protein